MTDLIGKRIKQYQIETLLGEGGMGAVYRALDTNLQRPVAIKVMHPHYARQPAFRHRFRQNEAQGVARLDHPSIIPVYDTGLENGILFIVMAFVPGANLASHIRHMQSQGKVVPLSETLFILAQVADALHYAHVQGVVHRDIKPDNILLKQLASPERAGEPPLRAVVTDFGLAHLEEGDDITKTGTFMGTLPYMSPEQCLGEAVDGGTDIYALGIILFHLSTGRLPFRFKSVGDAIQKHLHSPMPSPRSLKPELPEAVEAVIHKATAKQRSDRYASAADLAAAFREAAEQLSPEAVTLHATVTGSHSLLTQLQSPSLYPEPSRLGLSMAMPGSGDQLVVAKQGEPPRMVSLDKPTLTIGRTEDNDLPLPATGVSKRHALLKQTDAGWQIIDTQSTNGIYLKNQRLTAELAHPWPAGQPLRLGPYILRWQRAGQVPGTRVGAGNTQASWMGSQMSLAPVGASSQFSRSGTLNVMLNPTDVALPPGGKTDLTVTIQNLGFQVDHPSLTLDGIPDSWYQIPQNATQLMPEAEASLTVSLQPPADAKAEAYPIRLRLHSQAQEGEVTTVSAQLTVTPQEQFSLSLSPSQLQHGDVTLATIHNLGNVATTYRLVGRDPANALLFANAGERLRLRPGEMKDVPIKVSARQQPWLGQVALRPFELVAASQNGQQQVLAGQLAVPPRIPTWLASVAGMLLLFLCGGGMLLAFTLFNADGEPTPVAQTTQVVQVDAEGTATALMATSVAATATGEYAREVGDADNDGISDEDEVALGTNPNNPDTDGDGLLDGQEINQFGTIPTKLDSDDDGLSDGVELNEMNTDPLNADTDGDGFLDNNDPEPLVFFVVEPEVAETLSFVPSETIVNPVVTTQTVAETLAPPTNLSATPPPSFTPSSTPSITPSIPPSVTPTNTSTPTPTVTPLPPCQATVVSYEPPREYQTITYPVEITFPVRHFRWSLKNYHVFGDRDLNGDTAVEVEIEIFFQNNIIYIKRYADFQEVNSNGFRDGDKTRFTLNTDIIQIWANTPSGWQISRVTTNDGNLITRISQQYGGNQHDGHDFINPSGPTIDLTIWADSEGDDEPRIFFDLEPITIHLEQVENCR